ncbi:hypothetical protein A9G45_01645 [Gilliamella sp. HK2]|uniref:DUF6708 domain-containing protein n=1 Tax=Gilliamella sp. HK2 TaxID=3120246 RepID=UPI00080E2764|nr:DUF6708 domain-containing protein [Gilliamella apicola]OCG31069.1 hypothetical protein A9G45_01645 [Gilliamella apicola]
MPSKYQPQVSAWREDLYKGVYTTRHYLSNNKKLRYANDDYCEFSRRTIGWKWVPRWITIICLVMLILLLIFGVYIAFYGITFETEGILISIPFGLLFLYLIYFFLQLVFYLFYAPEDCPVRFNRKTGKVYIYDHFLLYFGSLETFTRSPFRVKEIAMKEFDWADIQGVMTSVSAPISGGGMVRTYRIECVVCEPNTTNVIDHFTFCIDSSLSYDEWMWVNSFMAFSDKNLDTEQMPDEYEWSVKINWSEELDKKSKASSLEEYQQIDAEYKKLGNK